MASLLIGSALGYFFGPLGFLAGSALGALLDPQKGPQISDLHLQGSTYGAVIPICYGTMRVAGQVIWTTNLHPHQNKGKGGGGPEVTTYTASFDVLICEGPISGIQRIWADGTLIYDTTGTVTGLPSLPMVFYSGAETQLPDPTEESAMGVGFVPAYRGYARVVFTELDLTNYGNSLPRLTFQVFTASGVVPWRVSSFTPWSLTTGKAGATFNGSVITISQPDSAGNVDVSQWTTQGVQIGPTVTSPGGTQTIPIVGVNAWAGLVGGGGGTYHFFTIDPVALTSIDLGLANGLTGILGSPYELGGNWPVFCNGFIYTIGDSGAGSQVLGQYNCPGGIPGLFNTSYTFAGTDKIKALGTSDTGHIYVITRDASLNTTLWRFLPGSGLTLDTSWNNATVSPTHVGSGNFNDFFVYQNVICTQWQVAASQDSIGLTQINGPLLTDISVILTTTGARPQFLGGSTGLGIDPLGVFSVLPPSGPVPLSTIVADISNRCGLAASQYNVAALIDLVPGFLISNQSTGRDNIMELRTAYFFDAVESSSVLNFVKRGGPSVISIPDNDLAAQSGHTGTPPPLALVERTQEVDLPNTMYVVFIDPNDQYLNGTQYARRLVTNSQTVATVQLAVALTVSTARAVAQLLLYTAWLERNVITFILSRQYAVYEPTDVITAHGYTIRVTDKTYVANNLIQLKGVVTNTGTFIAGPGGAVSGGNPNGPPTTSSQSPTNLLMLNLPLIVDTDYPYGPYAAMAGSSATLPWGGGILYESTDGGTTYKQITSESTPQVMGLVTSPPGNFLGGNIFDKINSFVVTIGNGGGTLSSATESAVLNGANVAYIGSGSGSTGEVIQFASATLVAANTYVLSDLLRGRRGTEWQMGQHAAGELFLLLPSLDINGPYSDLGQPRQWKALSGGQALAAVTPQTFIDTGETLRPYSPTNIYGASDGSGNVTINWTRRTRIGGQWADFTDVPLSESSESYVLQIWNSTFTVCARVVGGNQSNPASGPATITSPTFVYTAAMQTADFGQNEQHIYVSIGQLGSFGLGVQAFATIAGGGGSDVAPLHPVAPYNTGNPNTGPPPGCVGTPITGTSGNAFTWQAQSVLPSGAFGSSNYWQITIPVPASPVKGLCKITLLTYAGGNLQTGSMSATLSATPCGPPLIPAVQVSGQSAITINFSIGPSPAPQTTPQLLASTTYYLTVYTTASQLVQATLYTQEAWGGTCSGYNGTQTVALSWGSVPAGGQITQPVPSFLGGSAVVVSFTTPAGTSSNVGFLSLSEYGSAPQTQTAAGPNLSQCDFSHNVVSQQEIQVFFTVGAQLSPNTTYYWNLTHQFNGGVLVTLQKPAGL